MRRHLIIACTLIALLFTTSVSLQANTIQQLAKLFGIGYAVRAFAPQLNHVINTLTINHGAEDELATKVVPILTVGSGAYIGAAQVSGPRAQVERVEAVAQFEGELYDGALRVKGMVPVDTLNPVQGVKRVDEVGISALLDLQL